MSRIIPLAAFRSAVHGVWAPVVGAAVADTAYATGVAESGVRDPKTGVVVGVDLDAHNTNGEDSRGPMQINVGPGANTQYGSRNLFDLNTNLRTALQLYQTQGNSFHPWSGWTSGNYKAFLPQGGGGGGVVNQTSTERADPAGGGDPFGGTATRKPFQHVGNGIVFDPNTGHYLVEATGLDGERIFVPASEQEIRTAGIDVPTLTESIRVHDAEIDQAKRNAADAEHRQAFDEQKYWTDRGDTLFQQRQSIALQRDQLALAQQQANKPEVRLVNGTWQAIHPDGTATPVTGADGKPLTEETPAQARQVEANIRATEQTRADLQRLGEQDTQNRFTAGENATTRAANAEQSRLDREQRIAAEEINTNFLRDKLRTETAAGDKDRALKTQEMLDAKQAQLESLKVQHEGLDLQRAQAVAGEQRAQRQDRQQQARDLADYSAQPGDVGRVSALIEAGGTRGSPSPISTAIGSGQSVITDTSLEPLAMLFEQRSQQQRAPGLLAQATQRAQDAGARPLTHYSEDDIRNLPNTTVSSAGGHVDYTNDPANVMRVVRGESVPGVDEQSTVNYRDVPHFAEGSGGWIPAPSEFEAGDSPVGPPSPWQEDVQVRDPEHNAQLKVNPAPATKGLMAQARDAAGQPVQPSTGSPLGVLGLLLNVAQQILAGDSGGGAQPPIRDVASTSPSAGRTGPLAQAAAKAGMSMAGGKPAFALGTGFFDQWLDSDPLDGPGPSPSPESLGQARDFLKRAGQRALTRGGFGSVPTPVSVSAPGTSKYSQQLAAGAAGINTGFPASEFLNEADTLTPMGWDRYGAQRLLTGRTR